MCLKYFSTTRTLIRRVMRISYITPHSSIRERLGPCVSRNYTTA